MNAITLLKNDHRRIAKLLRDFEKTGDRAFRERQRVAAKVFKELEIHMKAEEEIFYPAVETVADLKGNLVREAIGEHEIVQNTVNELKRTDPDAKTYAPNFKALTQRIERHIKKEEGRMLPAAQRELGQKRLEYLGARMAGSRRLPPSGSFTLLGDTLRQAKTVVTKAFDVLRSTEPAQQTTLRGAPSAAGPRTAGQEQRAQTDSKRHSRKAKGRDTSQPARAEKSVPGSPRLHAVLRSHGKSKAVGKKKGSTVGSRRVAK